MTAGGGVDSWEVFGSEYDSTLYVMPKGQWEGRGGPKTICVIHEGIHDAKAKAEQIAALPDFTAKVAELIAADREYDEAKAAWREIEANSSANESPDSWRTSAAQAESNAEHRVTAATARRASALAALEQQS